MATPLSSWKWGFTVSTWYSSTPARITSKSAVSAAGETPGRYQAALPIRESLWRPGGNVLVGLEQGNVDADTKFFGFRFQAVTIPVGATVDVAYLELYLYNANLDEPLHTIYAEDGANPAAFSTATSDISSRTGTTATVTWDNSDTGATGFVQTPSLVSVVQALVDTHDYSGGAPVVFAGESPFLES